MRTAPCLVLLGALLLAPGFVASADEPAPPAPKDGPGTAVPDGPKPPEAPAAPEAGAIPEAPKPQETPPEPEKAHAAYDRIRAAAREKPQGAAAVLEEQARKYLADAKAREARFEGEESLYFARLQAMAGERTAGLATLRSLLQDGSAAADLLDDARLALVDLTAAAARGGDLKDAALATAVDEARAALASVQGERTRALRGSLHLQLAATLQSLRRDAEAMDHLVSAGTESPVLAPRAANQILDHLLAEANGPEAIPVARSAGKVILALFERARARALAEAKAAGQEGLVKSLEAAGRGLQAAALPLDLVGNPVPAWTVVHAFRGGAAPADYRGKVVLVDFWATWCPWCIRSFPALRALRQEYGARGFEVVGVTAPANTVYEARYDLDDDLKAKGGPDFKPAPALKLAPGADDAAKAQHRAQEVEVIGRFLANHEVPWDVVMIDEKEPSARYGLTGWPYGLLVDRQGRIRHLHSGAILKDRAEQMAEVRRRIEALLAEPP